MHFSLAPTNYISAVIPAIPLSSLSSGVFLTVKFVQSCMAAKLNKSCCWSTTKNDLDEHHILKHKNKHTYLENFRALFPQYFLLLMGKLLYAVYGSHRCASH